MAATQPALIVQQFRSGGAQSDSQSRSTGMSKFWAQSDSESESEVASSASEEEARRPTTTGNRWAFDSDSGA